mmetsp:Transcript_22601/g.70435  ORF Transcript_22601/g.70435 Transcript_22601/m.70435 type:complete len:241 (+) Transcript_22601:101-823(+)
MGDSSCVGGEDAEAPPGAADRLISAAGHSFSVRELHDGPVGVMLFPAAQQLLDNLAGIRDWDGVRVVELGAGTGALAIGLAKLGATVYATDFDAAALENLRFNVDRNGVGHRVRVLRWDWAERPPPQLQLDGVQYCVGSEVAYAGNAELLCGAIARLRASIPEVEVHLMLRERGGRTVHSLVECCRGAGLEVHLEPLPCPGRPEDYALLCEDPEEWGDSPAFLPGAVSLLRLQAPAAAAP